MTARFERLLTVNNLGFFHIGETGWYIASESAQGILVLNDSEVKQLVSIILIGKDLPLEHRNTSVAVKFKEPGQVTIAWQGSDVTEEATFEEVQLVKIIDIDKVHFLVVTREAARKAHQNLYL